MIPNESERCGEFANVSFPGEDRPTESDRESLAAMASYRLYDGIGGPVDYVAARKRAFAEIEEGDRRVLGGRRVLMMIYANGLGTARNLDLALKLACNDGGTGWDPAEAEREFRVAHLLELKRGEGRRNFDYCDDATSGFLVGACAGRWEERMAEVRERQLDLLTAAWPTADRENFGVMKQSAYAFFRAHAENEVDLSGTMRASFQVGEESGLKDDLLGHLRRFEGGERPWTAINPVDLAAEEKHQRLLERLREQSPIENGTVTSEGIAATERVWLTYRDSWVRFAVARYAGGPPGAWRAWLTVQRTEQLKSFLPIEDQR